MIERNANIIRSDFGVDKAIREIQSYIEGIESNASLVNSEAFDQRVEALDLMEFQVFDRVDELLSGRTQKAQLILLKSRAEAVKAELEDIDSKLFQKVRADIKTQKLAGEKFKDLIGKYVDFDLSDTTHQHEAGYDNLDVFINGLLCFDAMPKQTRELEPEMVFYQKTPARIIFELAEKAGFKKDDVFFDLGSGLGQVGILVNLLTGIKTVGIEFEPAFCEYATACATKLNLAHAAFVNTDARTADYSKGTVFFMYTPFNGEMMEVVLAGLKAESLKRQIKIITYGPCTVYIALQNWLHAVKPVSNNIYELGFFISI